MNNDRNNRSLFLTKTIVRLKNNVQEESENLYVYLDICTSLI